MPGVPAGATCLVWETDTHGLISNVPGRAAALSIRIPIDVTVASATAEIVNTTEEELPPATTTTTTTTTGATTTSTTVPPAGGVGGVGGDAGGGGTLPATGSDAARVLAVAALLIGLGALTIGTVRRRRT